MQISKTWVDDYHTTASSSSSFLKFSSIKRRIHSPIPFVYLFTFCHLPACEFPSTLSGFSLHFRVFLLSSLFCWLFFPLFSHEYFHIFMWPLFGFLRLRLLTPATPTLSWQLWAKLSAADCLPSSEVACVGPCYLIGFCDSEDEHQMAGCSAQWESSI